MWMCCFYHASNTINLVTASVDASVGIVEHTIFMPDLVDCSATTHRVIFAKYVAQISKQQGRYAVGHGLSPLAEFMGIDYGPRLRGYDCDSGGIFRTGD